MKTFYTLLKKVYAVSKLSWVFAILLILNASYSWGQTTLFNDNFNSNNSATFSTTGAIGTYPNWSLTRAGVDWGARVNSSQLELSNDASASGNVSGWVFGYRDINALAGWNTTLSSNTGTVTWEFNMQQIRTDPAGFGAGSYGAAFILAGTSTTSATAGSGYAVVLGQSGATDPIRLAHFNNGLQGTVTNLITSNTSGLTDFGTEYLSVRVTYVPGTNTWGLFLRNDGASFVDPATGSLTSQGTIVNNTYTATAGMRYIGGYWQGSTAATQTAFFDNVYLKKTDPVPSLTTTAISAITNDAAASGGNITNDGGSAVTARGVVWNTTINPVLPGLGNTSNGSGIGSFSSSLTSLSPQTQYHVRAYATNSTTTGYGDNISFFTLSNPPSQQPTNLFASALSTSQINLSWEAATFPGSGATVKGYVILRAISPNNPTLASNNGQAPAAGANTTLVSAAVAEAALSFSNTGLTAGTTYNYLLIPYCWDGTNAVTYHYYTPGAPTAYATTQAPSCTLPTIQASGISFSNITSSSLQVNWTVGNGDRSMVIVKQGSAVNSLPTTGVAYSANNQFGLGDNLGSGNYVAYYGTANNVVISDLNPSTTYYFSVITANNSGNCYLVSSPLSGNATTGVFSGFIETFEPGSKASYANGNAICNTGLWNFNDALIGTSPQDKKNNLKSARIQSNGSITMLFDKSNGAGTVTLRSAVFDVDASSTWQLQVSDNAGASFDAYQSALITTANSALATQTFTVNVSGNIRIRIVKSGGGRLNIDNIDIGDYIPANIITTGTITGSPYCITDAAGSSVTVPFTSTGTFNAGNTYTAQLSDGTGNFSIPLNIGTLTSTANSGNITAEIPAGTFTGSAYRIRVISNDPVVTGSSNSTNLNVYLNVPDVVNLYASINTSTSLQLNWTNPLACFDQILVVSKASNPVTASPSGDGSAYMANSVFSTGGSGASLPANEYAVYKGTGNVVTVTGLTSGTTYFFEVFVRRGSLWSPGVIIAAEPIPVQTGDFRSKVNGNYNVAATWETYNGSSWVNAVSWPNSSGTFPGSVNVTISHQVVITTSHSNQPINNLTVVTNGRLWANDSSTNGNRYLTIFGDIFCNGTGIIGNAYNKYDNISFNIDGATNSINGTGGFFASRLRKNFTSNPVTNLIIAKDIALKFNSGTAGSSGTVIFNNVAPSTFNVTVNANTVVDILLSTGSSGNISVDGIDGQGSGERGGTVTVNGTLNVPGTLFMLTDNATAPVVYQIGNTGVINCVNVCTGNTAVTSPINLSNGSHTGTSTLRILNGGRLNLTGGSASDNNTYNKPFSLRNNTSSPYTYVAGLATNANTIYDFQTGSIVEYSNATGTMPIQCSTLTYSNILFSNSGTKTMNNVLNVNRDLAIFSPAILNTQNNNINLGGDWINYGSSGFSEGTSTVTCNGATTQTIVCPSFENFYNLTITNASTGGLVAAANMNISNELDLSTNGKLIFGNSPIVVNLTNMTDASNSLKGSGTALIDLSSAAHTLIIGSQSPTYSGQFNAGSTSLVSYNRNSSVSTTTGNQNIITNITYANLNLVGTDNKLSADNFTVLSDLSIDGSSTVFQATVSGKSLTLGGHLTLSSNSTMHTNCFDNLSIITQGNNNQVFNGGVSAIRCFQLQSVKSNGGIQLTGPANVTTVLIKSDLILNYSVNALFTDQSNLIEVGDDAELGGTQANYNLSGTMKFTLAGTPTATDAHISNASGTGMTGAEFNNIIIEPVTGASVSQLDIYPISGGQILTIKKNLDILNTNLTGTILHPRSNTIRIQGNWGTYSDAGFNQSGSTVEFISSADPQTISSSNKEVFDNVLINTNQQVLLNAPIDVSGTLTLNSGKIQTGAYTVHHLNASPAALGTYNNSSYINGNYRRNVNATGTYAFPVGNAANLQDVVITLNSSSGMSNILAYFTSGLPATLPSTNCLINWSTVTNMLNGGYWTVEPNAYSSVNYGIELRQRGYTNFTGNSTMLGVIKRTNSSSPWQGTNYAGVNGFHNNATQTISGGVATAIRTSVTSFSDFGIGFTGTPLPVQLTAFDATVIPQRRVLLNWVTASELNSDYFEVQRSIDAVSFETIGKVASAGFSISELNYLLTDENPYSGISYYRLKQVDTADRFTFSAIRKVDITDGLDKKVQAYPNPVGETLYIEGINNDALTQIVISDISGRALISQSDYHVQQIRLNELPAGHYLLSYLNNSQHGVISFIKK
ncbi:MAG: T9SS type A sorting domain-containing protein [Bacteroidota bacterium]